MKTDVMVPDQYNQFCVSGVSEHPVEAPHVVLPVLWRHNNTNTNIRGSFQALVLRRGGKKGKLPQEAYES